MAQQHQENLPTTVSGSADGAAVGGSQAQPAGRARVPRRRRCDGDEVFGADHPLGGQRQGHRLRVYEGAASWPFLYHLDEDGSLYINRAARGKDPVPDVGEALW